MTPVSYPPPVDKLLSLGDCYASIDKWPNYLELGLGNEHIPELIRLATDVELFKADSDGPEIWALIHACRVLGQLRAEAAIEPLMILFHELEDSDWTTEELPFVYGLLGAMAIPRLADYLATQPDGPFPCITAVSCLKQIGRMHPDALPECVAAITHQLELFAQNDPTLNGFLISALIDLKAVESAPIMEQAFAANCVDLSVLGDWDDAQVYLGLKSRADLPKRRLVFSEDLANDAYLAEPSITDEEVQSYRTPAAKAKAKTKRKIAQKSRRHDRKRK